MPRTRAQANDDELPVPKKVVKTTASKKTAAAPPKKKASPPPEDLADLDAEDEMEETEQVGRLNSRRLTTVARKRQELQDVLKARSSGEPTFPYAEDLAEHLRPFWKELVNSKPHDYFIRADHPLLMMYCRVAYDLQRLDKEIEEEGEVIMNAKGNPIVNPRVVVRSIAETRLLALLTKLRSQPASRQTAENDREQTRKCRTADRAARTIGEDDSDEEAGLLARPVPGGSRTVN